MTDHLTSLRTILSQSNDGMLQASADAAEYTDAVHQFRRFDRIRTIAHQLLRAHGEPMKPYTFVASIPGCATRFARAVINAAGACHIHAERMADALSDEEIIVVPLRHPKSVRESWSSRHRYFPSPWTFDWFWQRLHEILLERPDIYLLPVDHPTYRDDCLSAIGKRVGSKLSTNWEKVGHEDPQKQKKGMKVLADMDLIMAYPYVRQFYDKEVPK